jgi:hypothetical protein
LDDRIRTDPSSGVGVAVGVSDAVRVADGVRLDVGVLDGGGVGV